MPIDPVEKIANAVLYEGYILYPYRADVVKNRQRFNFGAVYPPAHRQAQAGADSDTMEIECLVSCGAAARNHPSDARIEARVRFLHLQAREVFRLVSSAEALVSSSADPACEIVDSLVIDGHVHQTWQEAVERDIVVADLSLAELAARPASHDFALPASRLSEPLSEAGGAVVGRIVRRQNEIAGVATLAAEQLASGVFKLRLVINNVTPLADSSLSNRDEVLLSTFISTHALMRVAGGEFVSLLEPPDALRSAVAMCRNVGAWPVLAGEPERRDRLLASPIILYDYPQVAPESSGDWCEGAEIDEMLVLRVMTLTADEKRAMRDVDRRAREILERAESITEDQMLRLHGAFRGLERNGTPRAGEGTAT